MNFYFSECIFSFQIVTRSIADAKVASDGEGLGLLLDLGVGFDLRFLLDLGRTLGLALDALRTRRIRACRFARRTPALSLAVTATSTRQTGDFHLALRARVARCALAFHLPARAGVTLHAAVSQLAVGAGLAVPAVIFHLPVRARVALRAVVFLLPMRAALGCAAHQS